ncbi:unnamed protein product [Darwinula stevensoni]|uniref:Uncharacterized protein n=1 Tax=Darwinula stevensoni TaxID=69355 RepID=A0A7R8XK80_9CRUS|nr:unnamed protein product [Darwinula stevensoni]CAG0896031.1 unnamed protein product [Darwinula stevensoni]
MNPSSVAIDTSSQVSLLDAVRFVAKSWWAVKSETIANRFRRVGFHSGPEVRASAQFKIQTGIFQLDQICKFGPFPTVKELENSRTLKSVDSFTLVEKDLLIRRSQVKKIEAVCAHHAEQFLRTFEIREKSCCDPFGIHTGQSRKRNFRTIDVETCDQYSAVILLIPGKKLCTSCRKILPEKLRESQEYLAGSSSSTSSVATPETMEDDIIQPGPSTQIKRLNESLQMMGETPVKGEKMAQKKYPKENRRKIAETVNKHFQYLSASHNEAIGDEVVYRVISKLCGDIISYSCMKQRNVYLQVFDEAAERVHFVDSEPVWVIGEDVIVKYDVADCYSPNAWDFIALYKIGLQKATPRKMNAGDVFTCHYLGSS